MTFDDSRKTVPSQFITAAKVLAVAVVVVSIVSTVAVGIYTNQPKIFFSTRSSHSPAAVTEITFQHFLTHLLNEQRVERLDIVNWDIAKVVLRSHTPQQRQLSSDTLHSLTQETSPPDVDSQYDGSHPSYVFRIGSLESFYSQLHAFQSSIGYNPKDFVPVKHVVEHKSFIASHFSEMMTILVHIILVIAINQKTMIGSSRTKQLNTKNCTTSVRLSDVAGMSEAKSEVKEFVDFLKHPAKYEQLGAVMPKGALLVGPPGTGKTLLARAIAGEAGVPFYSISGSEFVEEFVGVGASRVRSLFQEARKNAPSIVFIDEIDSVGRSRSSGGSEQKRGANDERENTLNQMLVEMDGFTTSTGVVVLAGTNRADILDPALTRPGRFDRTVTIEKPDLSERTEMFEIHMKPLTLDTSLVPQETYRRLAALTPGFVGADIRNVCNEAAIYAARRDASGVSIQDFENACERVLGGMKKSSGFINQELRRVIAFHEAGHAVAGWFLKYGDPVLKVSIVPRTNGALGYAQNLPEETQLLSKEEVFDKIAVLLAGRISEELHIGQISTGAADDLQKVTALVFASVREWGFSSSGLFSFPNHGSDQFYKPYSDHLAQLMDRDASSILNEQYNRVKDLLKSKRELLHQLANRLLEQETITFTDLNEILGKRPFPLKEGYGQYVEASPKRRVEELNEGSITKS